MAKKPVNKLFKWSIGSPGSTKYPYELTTELQSNTKLYFDCPFQHLYFLIYHSDNNETDLLYIGSKI